MKIIGVCRRDANHLFQLNGDYRPGDVVKRQDFTPLKNTKLVKNEIYCLHTDHPFPEVNVREHAVAYVWLFK